MIKGRDLWHEPRSSSFQHPCCSVLEHSFIYSTMLASTKMMSTRTEGSRKGKHPIPTPEHITETQSKLGSWKICQYCCFSESNFKLPIIRRVLIRKNTTFMNTKYFKHYTKSPVFAHIAEMLLGWEYLKT